MVAFKPSISRNTASPHSALYFTYDATGNRVAKKVFSSLGVLQGITYYIRDAQGNVMSVYTKNPEENLTLTEQHPYGSARLGMHTKDLDMTTAGTFNDEGTHASIRGEKSFELSNHLGNVLSVITDQKSAVASTSTIDHFIAEVLSYTDYYPFGAPMDNGASASDRSWSGYRYGFNSQEKEQEIAGEGNMYSAEYWMYDGRLGRRWNVDPLYYDKFWISTYHAFSNRPTHNIDPNGALDTKYETEDGELITETEDGNDAIVTVDEAKVKEFKSDLDNGPIDKNSPTNNAKWITKYASSIAVAESSPSFSNKTASISAWALSSFIAGAGSEILEQTTGSFRVWTKNGSELSPKYYSSGWGGGSTSQIRTYNISKVGKVITASLVIADTSMDMYGLVLYYTEGEKAKGAVNPLEFTIGLAVTYVSLYSCPPAGVAYDLIEIFYPDGMGGFMIDGTESQNELNEMSGYKIRLIPFGMK